MPIADSRVAQLCARNISGFARCIFAVACARDRALDTRAPLLGQSSASVWVSIAAGRTRRFPRACVPGRMRHLAESSAERLHLPPRPCDAGV